MHNLIERRTYLNCKAAMYAAISAAWSAEAELILIVFTCSVREVDRVQKKQEEGEFSAEIVARV